MTKRTPKARAPETREEIIKSVLDREVRMRFQPEPIEPINHLTRSFSVGDHVEIGNLDDVRIEAIIDDRYIVVSYASHKNVLAEFEGRGWGCWPWFEVYPEQEEKGHRDVQRFRCHSWINTSLHSIIRMATEGEIRDNQDYQRGYVWTLEDKRRFIRSIFDGMDIGKFVFLKFAYPDNKHEVLDGKQRLSAIRDYVWGQFAVEDTAGRPVWFHTLTRTDRHEFEGRMVQFVELVGEEFTRADRLRLFLELNIAGVPQTEEHLSHVRDLLAAEIEREHGSIV